MDTRKNKHHNIKLFPHSKKKLNCEFKLEVEGENVVFNMFGPKKEAEMRFYHVLQVINKVSFYQVDGNIPEIFKGHSLYRFGINLNSNQVLSDMFWYLRETWSYSLNDGKLFIDFYKTNPSTDLKKTLEYAAIDSLGRYMKTLPEFVPPKHLEKNNEHEKSHHRLHK